MVTKEYTGERHIPPLRFRWLTRFYDPLLRVTLREDSIRARTIAEVDPRPNDRILDLGCGTGSLTQRLKLACPNAKIVGLDPDPDALRVAREKLAGLDVELQHGSAVDPPFESGSFDKIISSLVFHHLRSEEKRIALTKARDLLRPGGEIHIADWGRAQNALMRAAFLSVQLLDGFPTTSDNVRGRLPLMIREAGFIDVAETHRQMTMFGTLSLYRGRTPKRNA